MKPATPRFVGARLKEGREARGFTTAVALADVIEVSRAAISQYENDVATPRAEIMERITQKLNLPAEFFCRPVRPGPEPTVFYRCLTAATKAVRMRAERRFNWLSEELVPYVTNFVEVPSVRFPSLRLSVNPLALSMAQVEEAARTVRDFWRLKDGPISNVVWLLENHGAVITRGELDAEELDSFSAWVDDRPYIFLNADKASAVRSRFDAAHELAHLVLHREVDRKAITRAADHRILEDQAHRFAGAFLFPDTRFLDEVYAPTLEGFRSLKPRWGMAIGAMIARAAHLRLVDGEGARRLWMSRARRGWNRREPLDDELEIEVPHVQRDSFELLVGEGIQTRADVLASLPYAASDIEALAMLPHGFLSDTPARVRLLELPTDRRTGPRQPQADDGEVVRFPRV